MANEQQRLQRHYRIVRVFELAEIVLYAVVAVFLVVIAVISLINVVGNIANYLVTNTPILGLQELFLTIIVLELLMTVVGYMKNRSINLGLLLGAGLTAMIRKLITVGYLPIAAQELALILAAIAILVAAIIFIGDRTVHA